MNSHALHAFKEALKTAALPMAVARAAGRVISESPARGALAGAGLGAVGSIATRQEGESAIGAGIRGGLLGGAAGGSVAGAGRAFRDTRLLARSQGKNLSAGGTVAEMAKGVGRGAKNFGKRQLHGLTGAFADEAGTIGMRSTGEAARQQKLLDLRLADRVQGGKKISPAKADRLIKDHHEESMSLSRWGRQGDAALNSGITSIPGVAKGLVERPRQTMKALGKEVMGGGGMAAATAVGIPVAISAPDLVRGDETAIGGRSMKQKLVSAGSGLAGGVLTAGMPGIPQVLGGMAVDSAANRTLGRTRRLAPAAPHTQQIGAA